ncbi:MAG TPA: hypothetical protein VNN07_04560 [Candidatus Tectomicrobia bacterium]|nr:hypothetical protein [Candidatus Tectomicrobia bacterium]
MRANVRCGLGGLMVAVALAAVPASAQDMTAEVKTWGGEAWKLTQSSFEVFYTIAVPKTDAEDQPTVAAGGTGTGPSVAIYGGAVGGRRGTGGIQGSLFAEARGYDEGSPDALQGRRRRDYITLFWQGTEIRVAVDAIASLLFRRQPIANDVLPPWVGTRYRHGVTAVLTDGTQVEADYVNMGTTILRGMAPQGRVDIAWDDIESVRFTR